MPSQLVKSPFVCVSILTLIAIFSEIVYEYNSIQQSPVATFKLFS